MFIHKYVSDGDTFYRVSSRTGKPGKTTNLTSREWHGKVSGSAASIGRAINILNDAKWSMEDEEEVKQEKKASIANVIKSFTESIK